MRSLAVGLVGLGWVVTAGCGGKVVVDLPASGHGGAGGAGTTTTSTTGTPTTTTTTTSTTTTTTTSTTTTSTTTTSTTTTSDVASSTSSGPVDLCPQVCNQLAAKGCGGGPCVASCQSMTMGFGSGCAALATALVSCMAASLPTATACFDATCDSERTALMACVTGTSCMIATYDGFNGSMCFGKGGCPQLMGEPGETCDGSGVCTCGFITGALNPIGKCQETGPFVCDIDRGCCAQVFGLQP